jgi:hypothetical protein
MCAPFCSVPPIGTSTVVVALRDALAQLGAGERLEIDRREAGGRDGRRGEGRDRRQSAQAASTTGAKTRLIAGTRC